MTLEKVLRWIVIIGIFCLPFVPLIIADGVHFPYNLFFPFITGKNFVFRILVEAIAGAWLALALVNVKYRPRRSWILGTLALFVAVMAVADFFGANPGKSIWSNYERMDGLVTLVHLLIYTVVAVSVLSTERLWRSLFWVSLAVSVYLSVYGFLQVAGFSTLGGGGSGSLTARVDASFGNPIYLAAYMLFHIFIAALLWAQQWSERRAGDRLPISLAYGFIILIDTLALLATGTRGTILGLGGGAFITAVLVLWQASNSKTAWRVSVGTAVAIVVLAGGIWASSGAAWVHNIGFLERLTTISLHESTVKARFLNWSIAWQGVQERPLLGWGQENYAIVFDKYYDPRMYAQEPWFDRVHNVFFDWLVAGGFLGLFTYLSIFAAALYVLWKKGFGIAERSILTGLLFAYFCHNFFVFDNVSSYILFGTILAYMVYRSTDTTENIPAGSLLPETSLPYTALVGALFVAVVMPWANLNAFNANRMLIQSISPQQEGVGKNLQLFESTIALNTYGTQEAREQLAQAASQIASVNGVPADVKRQFAETGVKEMQAQELVSPLDARFPLFLGGIYGAFGDYQDAATALAKAHELSPKKQSIYFQIAQNDELRGDGAGALAAYKAAFDLEPSFNDARFFYAGELIRLGREAEAQPLIEPYIKSGDAADPRILAAYVTVKEYTKVIPLWEARILARPEEPQPYFTLAAIYYQIGDRTDAAATLERAKKAIPGLAAQADPLIQQIKSGTVQL